MTQLFRWILNGTAAMSAVLCVGTFVLCAIIPRHWYSLSWSRPSGASYSLEAYAGGVHFRREGMPRDFREPGLSLSHAGTADGLTLYTLHDAGNPGSRPRAFLGVRRYSHVEQVVYYPVGGRPPASARVRYDAVVVPGALLIPLLAVLPVLRAWHLLRRRRRARAGLCLACGYDLRATPERCPECGREPGRVAPGGPKARSNHHHHTKHA